MTLNGYYELMAAYNQWINRSLYETCASLSDEQRKRDLGAFFKSIHCTLNHILYSDKVWLGRFTNVPFSSPMVGQELYDDYAALRKAREDEDVRIMTCAGALSSQWLTGDFAYTSSIDGKHRVLPAWVAVTHFFNHQTHHRGQVTTLMKQLGADPGIMDIPWLPQLNPQAEERNGKSNG